MEKYIACAFRMANNKWLGHWPCVCVFVAPNKLAKSAKVTYLWGGLSRKPLITVFCLDMIVWQYVPQQNYSPWVEKLSGKKLSYTITYWLSCLLVNYSPYHLSFYLSVKLSLSHELSFHSHVNAFVNHWHRHMPSNLQYKTLKIPKLKCFNVSTSSCLCAMY